MPISRTASFDNVNAAGAGDVLLQVGDLTAGGFQSPGRFGFGQYVSVGNSGAGFCKFAFNHIGGGNSSTPRIIFGFAYQQNYTGNSSGNVLLLDASGAVIGGMHTYEDGSIAWDVGDPVLETVALSTKNQLYTPGVWCYIEFDITLSPTSGSVNIYVNGALVGGATGVPTSAGSSQGVNYETCSIFAFQYGYFDDVYIYDATGESSPSAPYGNVAIAGLLPTAAGRVSEWTPSPSSNPNWENVSEVGPDGDTTYNAASSAGLTDAYEIAALPTINGQAVTNIIAVQVSAITRIDAAGSRVVSVGVGNGTTESFDSGANPGSSYFQQYRTMPINPLTGEAWEVADISTLQAALTVVS